MTSTRNICLLILLLSFIVSIPEAEAQRKRKRKRTDKDKQEIAFKDRLWYGGGFVLGFGSTQNVSQFNFGISPMVGYKVTPNLSFGPRIDLQYTGARTSQGGNVLRFNGFNYGTGVFGRFKFLETFFLHAEYGYLSEEVYDSAGSLDGNKLPSKRLNDTQGLFGLGYNAGSGGPWATEISLLYNFLAADDDPNFPIDLRFGFTYLF